MRHKIFAFLSIATAALIVASAVPPRYAQADAICAVTSTPPPASIFGLTLPLCVKLAPGPGPTGPGGVPLVQPTNVPTLNAAVFGTGTAGVPATGVLTVQGIPFGYGLIVQIGGSTYTSLNSASPVTCTSIEVSSTGMLAEIINTGAAQVAFLQVYDEGVSPTCAAADVIYGDGATLVLGPGQITTFGIPLFRGLAYKITGGVLGANVLITRNG